MVIQCIFSDLERLKRDLNLDNYFLIKSFNESRNTFNKFTVKGIESFMAEQFSQIKDKHDFMLLDSEDLVGILRDAKLAPATEKWEAVVKWTKHDTSRAGYFLQLVEIIDVEVFTFNQLLDIVWEESLTQKSEKVKEFVARIIFSKKGELEEHVSIANCFHLMDVNIKYNSINCEETDVFLKKFLAKNIGETSQKEEFLLLPKDDVLPILKIAETNGVTNWQAMVRWMKFDASREDYLLEVMEVVDFEDSAVDFLLQNVYNEPLVQKSEVAKMRAVENILSDVCRLEKSINEDNCLDLKQLVDESSKHDDAGKVVNRYIMLNLECVGLKRGFLDLSFNGLFSLLQAPEAVIQPDATKWENLLKWVKHEETRNTHLPKLMDILKIKDFFLLFETVWSENLVQSSAEAKILLINGLFFDLEALRKNTDVNNCFHLRELNACDHVNKDEVGKLLSHFMMQHFEEITGREDFLNLNEDDLAMFLESPDTKISSEEVKREAIVKWVKHDKQRETVFSRLFKLLDLKRIDKKYLSSSVLNEPHVQGISETLVKESQKFVPQSIHHLEDRPRCVAILVKDETRSFWFRHTSELIILNLEDGSSCSVSISEDDFLGIVTIDREVYAVTMSEILQIHNDGTRTVLQDLRNDWRSVVVSFQKKIYIIQPDGGSMSCFDPARKSFIDNLPGCGLGSGFCAAADDDFIYTTGGWRTETSAKSFDPIARTWSEIPTMREKREDGAAATLDGKIYVMGGRYDRESVECFDPESNSWTEVASMNKRRSDFSAAVIDKRLYAVGGDYALKENGSFEYSIEVYDKQLNQWVIVEKFKTPNIDTSDEYRHQYRHEHTSACSWPHGSFKPGKIARRSGFTRPRSLVKKTSDKRSAELEDELHIRLSEEIERRIKRKSTESKWVDPEGGFLDNIGCKVTYPPKTFKKDTRVETSVITDFSDCPDQRIPIAPIIQCSPSGRLNRPAFLELETWAYPTRDDVPVYAEVFQKDEKDSEWRFFKEVRIEGNGKISFYAEHFSIFEVVVDYVKWFWSGLTRPFLQVALQNLVYISGTNQSIACVCCLKSDKIRRDVTQTLRDTGFHSLLPLPVNTHAFRGEEVKVAIRCLQPGNLEILPGGDNAGGARRVEKVFSVDDVCKRCEEFHYLPIALRDENLTIFKGNLRFQYSLAAEDDNVEHPMQTVWPIPGSAPTHVTNVQSTSHFYERIRTNTLLAPDPRENQ